MQVKAIATFSLTRNEVTFTIASAKQPERQISGERYKQKVKSGKARYRNGTNEEQDKKGSLLIAVYLSAV
jgi:hypothetical protein